MKDRSCIECRCCNHKGKPSVTKYSKYCDEQYLLSHKTTPKFFSFLFERVDHFKERFKKFQENRITTKGVKTKGFREVFFYDKR